MYIRKARKADISRIAEILIFTKRVSYRPIFQNDRVSFGTMQVLPLAEEFLSRPELLDCIRVYDDGIVKGVLHMEETRIEELYVEPCFQGNGIGTALINYAVAVFAADRLWVLEENSRAISFYQSHGFYLTGERVTEAGTSVYAAEMRRKVFGTEPLRHKEGVPDQCRQERTHEVTDIVGFHA